MDDLASLVGLPTTWIGANTAGMAASVADALLAMLGVDFVSITLRDEADEEIDLNRLSDRSELGDVELTTALSLPADPAADHLRIGRQSYRILTVPVGLSTAFGRIVAGAVRDSFGSETDALLLSVASSQVALALQERQRLREQATIAAELVQANEALRVSEREYREIVDNTPSLVGLLTPTGGVELVNRQILEFTGKSLEELTKWGMSDLVHPDDLPEAIKTFQAGFSGVEPFKIVYRMRNAQGAYRWFEGIHRPLRDADGRIARWAVACTDIHDRKQVEDALRATESAWRSVLDGIPGLTATLSPTGMVEAVNRQIIDYTGCELDELRGWGTNGIVHPEDMPHVGKVFLSSIEAGVPYEIEQRLRRHDGEYRWFSNRGTPDFDGEGNIRRWYVLLVDIHEARLVADALRASEENARYIVSSIAGMVAVFTPEGQLSGGNQQLLDYFDLPLEEVAKWATNGITHPDDLQHCIDSFMGSIASGEPYDFETRFRRANGEYRWFHIRGRPLRDANGKIVRWYGLLIDVDDRKQAEEAALRNEREARLIVDTIPGLIVHFSPEGVTQGCNRQVLDYVGQSFEEFAHWATNGTVPEEDLPAALDIFVASLRSGEPYEFEVRLRRHDGALRWFQIRGRPLRDSGGNILRWYGLLTDIDDRKRAEQTLAESERKARLVVASIPGLVLYFRPDGTLEGGNNQIFDYLGLTVDQTRQWETVGTVHPDDFQYASGVFGNALQTGDPYEMEIRIRRYDNTYRWFQVRGQADRDENGAIAAWYSLLYDIDDRKRAERELAASERNLQLTVDTIPALVWSARPDGTADFFNRHYLDYVGQTPQDLSGWAWTSAVHPEDLEKLGAVWQAARETGGGAECEARLRRFDGTYRWFIFRANPLHDEAGNVVKWYGINTDIEDRKNTEDELRRSRTFLARSQELSHTGSATFNVGTGEFSYSDEMYNLFEIAPGTRVTADLIASKVYEPDRGMTATRIRRANDGSSDAFDYEVRLKTSAGSIRTLRVRAQKVHHPDRGQEFLSIAQDVTEQRRAEETLDELRAELAHVSRVSTLGAMTASIAHEVNQPLAGIVTNASTCIRMLDANPPDIDGARETARRTIRDGNRAAEVVTRLRALFLKRGEIADDVDLNEAARDVIALAATELRKSRMELETDLAEGLPLVAGDRVQLQQVILNLLLNAADAVSSVNDRPRRTTIVTNQDEDGHVRLTVQDTGVGIDPGNLGRLFEAFYTTKEAGMGIGLSVSRTIIEHHGGRIWANANEGPGASVSFSIPVHSGGSARVAT
jgi:PAS domain S-box-containing protein